MLPRDPIEHRRVVAEAEAKLFGGTPAPITVGRFRIGRKLGEGGLGVVYAAEDPELERSVALKLLRVDPTRPRLLREARAMARLAHPNVVTVHEVGQDDDHVYIVMELVEGETLRQWLQAGRSWQEVLDVFVEAGRGLAAAHAAGLVHRDFKPENVLVGGSEPRARVTDFGLAREAADPATSRDGTPAYMAPEQRLGEATTAAADQFSFCVALYEALWGRRPFPDDDVTAAPVAPRDEEIPTLLWHAIRRGLRREPADRWPDLAALLQQLRPAPRSRRRTAILVFVSILLAILLTGAYLQLRMFGSWIADARP